MNILGLKRLLGCVGFLCLVSALPASSSWGQGGKIYLSIPNPENVDIAKKKGFFKSEGLDVETVVTRVNVAIAGLVAKNIDYAVLGGFLIRAAVSGLPVRMVLSLRDRPGYVLIGRPEIKSLEELRGKTVGVTLIGGAVDVVTRMVLERSGLVPGRDVQISPLGSSSARIGALEQGLVAAVPIDPRVGFQLEKQGYRILIKTADFPAYPFEGLGTTLETIRERPGEVKGMIKALLRANRFVQEERAQVIPLLMESWRMDRGMAERSYEELSQFFSLTGEPDAAGMKLAIDLARRDLGIKGEVPFSQVADFTLLKAAQKELGIR